MRKPLCAISIACFLSAVAAHAIGNRLNAEEKSLTVVVERAFPKLRIRRPIVITHANDGSDRIFIAEQQGVIRVLPNDQNVETTSVFLDIEDQVVYQDKQNEEGLLGVAFHPDYKDNGESFVYYTTTETPQMSVVSRFRVSKDDPNKADPDSEEEILRVKQPFWNHNGGTIEFGPDGYLYIALGDGGSRDDPHGNGQNLTTLLGSILRIDVDRKDEGKNYAVPKDNPFVNRDGACGEIWAYGLRNVWRFSFDRETGAMWAGDVGQDIWEEVDVIVRGGNYGWNLREAAHRFRPGGEKPRPDLIEPVWEYHHDVGKSITGGNVYRGKNVPELIGKYLYADYVSGIVWALDYDLEAEKVRENYRIAAGASAPVKTMPVITFGEDQSGEVYFSDSFGFLYRFQSTGM